MRAAWRRHRNWIIPALFLAPGLVLFVVVIVAASIESVWVSFFDWDGFGEKEWVGFGNYVELWSDQQFWVSLRNNIIWLAVFLMAPPAGLLLALLVNQKLRGMRFIKSMFFMPLVLSTVTVGVIFNWVYDPAFGLISWASQALGFGSVAVLANEYLVTWAVVLAALWPQVAFCMVLFLAGLNNLSEDQIGAGRVDGAKGWTMLRHVVLPQLSQIGFIALAVSVIGALRSFDMVAVMTSGGPFGSSTVLAYQMFEQSIFSYRYGYGAAIASVLFVIMLVFIVWYVRGLLRAEERGA
jgi:multiple sugar transport system permease protein